MTPRADQWNTAEFGRSHLPEPVSLVPLGRPDSIRVLDMPVKIRETLRVPGFLGPEVATAVEVALQWEATHYGWEPRYVYVTVDHKPAPPYGSQRRPGWHSDGWLTDEQGRQLDVITANARYLQRTSGHIDITYVNTSSLPTLYAPGPWVLPDRPSDADALHSFDRQAAGQQWWSPEPNLLVRLTPYCVHSAITNPDAEPVARVFVKISLSDHRYNMVGNTHNWLLDYNWYMLPRATGKRSHRFHPEGAAHG